MGGRKEGLKKGPDVVTKIWGLSAFLNKDWRAKVLGVHMHLCVRVCVNMFMCVSIGEGLEGTCWRLGDS